MDAIVLPFAANLKGLEEILPIVFMILYGLAHLIGTKRAKNNPPAKQPRPLPPQAVPVEKPGQPPQPQSLEEALRREVQEFLRRAQGQQPAPPAKKTSRSVPQAQSSAGNKAGQRPPQQSRTPQRSAPQATPNAPPRRLVGPAKPLAGDQLSAAPQTSRPTAVGPLGGGVAAHVQQHVDSSREALAQHAKQLGGRVVQADEKFEQQLRERFVHQVGTLKHQEVSAQHTASAQSPVAKELFDLMSRPGGARQLVVAGEILRRPTERWER